MAVLSRASYLRRSSRDVEPLVNAWVDGRRRLVVAFRDVELAWIHTIWAARDGSVGAATHVSDTAPNDCIGVAISHRLTSFLGVFPVTNFSHDSAHSRTTSMAYFLFLHSPLNANWFSGLPSGIL